MVFLLGKNRDRLSIIAAILEAANFGASKTHIMFNVNLSFSSERDDVQFMSESLYANLLSRFKRKAS